MLALRTLVTVALSVAATVGLALGASPKARQMVKATVREAARVGAEIGATIEQSIDGVSRWKFAGGIEAGHQARIGGAAESQTSLEAGASASNDVDLNLGDRIEAVLAVFAQPSIEAELSADGEAAIGGDANAGAQTNLLVEIQALFGR